MGKNGNGVRSQENCKTCVLRQFDCFAPFSDAEEQFMLGFKSGELVVEAGSTIVLEGAVSPHLFTVLDGNGIRHKSLEDGRRQVLGFLFPGDFVGLQGAVMNEMQHTVEAVTRMVLCVFQRRDLYSMYVKIPERGFDVTWLAAREEQVLGDHLMTVGRRNADERVAFGLWLLHQRARSVGMASKSRMEMPFTQQDLADALGLSLVHTNKMLRRLKDRGIVEWSSRTLHILDGERLMALAGVDEEVSRQRPLI